MFVGLMIVTVLGHGGYVRADFTFGDPINLGPIVNSGSYEESSSMSADGLSLYFASPPPSGVGDPDIWMTTRATKADEWGEPVHLGARVNTEYREQAPCISANGLELYFASSRGYTDINFDIWKTTRETTEDDWGEPVKLGPNVNSNEFDFATSLSPDGLSLFLGSTRGGGSWNADLWLTTRETTNDPWGAPVNLGPTINSPAHDGFPSVSADGRTLFFSGWGLAPYRSGGLGSDLWMTRRAATSDNWSMPVNLGPIVNSPANEVGPNISADGSTLYFTSNRPGGYGDWDLWQVSIDPVVDFNGDYRIDIEDLVILIEHWGQDEPSLDMGPTPLGDGVIDAADLEVLMSHWGQELPDPNLLGLWKLDETEGDIAYDSGAENDAVVMGDATWQPQDGQVDGALQFDGIDDYLAAPFILDPTKQAFSVYVWIKGGQPGQTIVSQQGAFGAWLSVDAAGTLSTGLTFPLPAVTSDVVITDGHWHHIGLVSDGSGISLYVDDTEVARSDVSPILPAYGDLQIGAGKNLEPGSFWSGLIDNLRIDSRVIVPEGQ